MEGSKTKNMISTLLVANRGEIAIRIMRTAKQLGIRTVAVYSDADAAAPHVNYADEAVYIGASPAGESYLRSDKILSAAQSAGANAIHPGYGFLSENAEFANAVAAAGLMFVGPGALAIEVMGDKAASKRAMLEVGVPCVPGYQGEDQSSARLLDECKNVGLPVMVKAAAGGGGRGMRLVESETEISAAIGLARSEAENAFGSGELIIEKAVRNARHVEIQVFADGHGNVIHLGERDCSVQRRHQKIIEESPCPVMTSELREAMGKAAIAAAKAVDYRGAGTVEFLLEENGEFYFLEMNTRLQVEHPVTEMVTGLDLVAMQLAVAEGRELGITQDQVEINGHAIEVRLYAEDPLNDFLPSTGPMLYWQEPKGEGIRVDGCAVSGGEISPFYDPMIAKVIAYGDNRDQAQRRLTAALQNTALFGIHTNRNFLLDVLANSVFAEGAANTGFIGEQYPAGYQQSAPSLNDYAVAAVLQYQLQLKIACNEALAIHPELLEWSSNGELETLVQFEIEGQLQNIFVQPGTDNEYQVSISDHSAIVSVLSFGDNAAKLRVDGKTVDLVFFEENESTLHLAVEGSPQFVVVDYTKKHSDDSVEGAEGLIVAPMHGCLTDVDVKEGDKVKAGDRLVVLEAMKMQHEICAAADGIVSRVAAGPGDQVAADDLLIELELAES